MNLSEITNNPDAVKFWLGLIDLSHTWDDLIDKDKDLSDRAIHEAFWFALCDLPNNQFYRTYQNYFQPLIISCCIDFIASVNMERENKREDLSHVLRYSLGRIINAIALIEKGKEFVMTQSDEVWEMIVDDTFEQYQKERKLCLAS